METNQMYHEIEMPIGKNVVMSNFVNRKYVLCACLIDAANTKRCPISIGSSSRFERRSKKGSKWLCEICEMGATRSVRARFESYFDAVAIETCFGRTSFDIGVRQRPSDRK